jgi:hypothetical protein
MTKDIVFQIEELTVNNNFIESYVLGAQYLKHKNLENIFKAIQKIQEIEGSLPYNLKDYRYEQVNKMLKYAEKILSASEYDRFRSAF